MPTAGVSIVRSAEPPVALTADFAADKQIQWRAFVARTQIALAPEPFPDVQARIEALIMAARNALKGIDEALRRLETAFVPGAKHQPGDILSVDPVLRQLIEEGKILEKQRDDSVSARLQLEQKVAIVEGLIAELLDQSGADASHITQFMARIRAMEVEASAAPVKRAA